MEPVLRRETLESFSEGSLWWNTRAQGSLSLHNRHPRVAFMLLTKAARFCLWAWITLRSQALQRGSQSPLPFQSNSEMGSVMSQSLQCFSVSFLFSDGYGRVLLCFLRGLRCGNLFIYILKASQTVKIADSENGTRQLMAANVRPSARSLRISTLSLGETGRRGLLSMM